MEGLLAKVGRKESELTHLGKKRIQNPSLRAEKCVKEGAFRDNERALTWQRWGLIFRRNNTPHASQRCASGGFLFVKSENRFFQARIDG